MISVLTVLAREEAAWSGRLLNKEKQIKILPILCDGLSEEQCDALVEMRNPTTILNFINSLEALHLILNKCSESKGINIIKTVLEFNPNLFLFKKSISYGFYNNHRDEKYVMIPAIIGLLPIAQRVEVFHLLNKENELIRSLFNYSDSVRALVDVFPKEQRIDIFRAKGLQGDFYLHRLSQFDPKDLQAIFESLAPAQQVELAQLKDEQGCTFLHYLKSPATLRLILDLYSQAQLFDLVQIKTSFGRTSIDNLCRVPEALHMVLQALPEEQRFEVLSPTLIASLALYCDQDEIALLSLQFIIESVAVRHRFGIIQVCDHNGYAVLYNAINHTEMFVAILSALSEEQRLSAWQLKDPEGTSYIDYFDSDCGELSDKISLFLLEYRHAMLNMEKTNESIVSSGLVS